MENCKTLTDVKKLIREMGLYFAIYEIAQQHSWGEKDNLREIILRCLDEIPQDILDKAVKKGTK